MSELKFGHIEGVPVGTEFKRYADMNAVGVHRASMAGISGRGAEGADSIVISGGYEDDQDFGDMVIYTGEGGRDTSGKHVKDQELKKGNLALVRSQLEGLPVRVIRGAHKGSPYAPEIGYRYDGLYRVESHWHEVGKSGFKVWRYRLVRLEGEMELKPSKTVPEFEVLSGGNFSPQRKTVTAERLIRNSRQAKKIKEHYGYRCQVCGVVIETPVGLYAEAAHIKPVGEPHNGPDTVDNLLCLCPNHHVMFDMGSFSVRDDFQLIGVEGKLLVSGGHSVSPDYLAYHRAFFLNKKKSS